MGVFDLKSALLLLGQDGVDPVDAIGMSFGVPSCLLNLSKEAMQLLPGDILSDISDSIIGGREKAQEVISDIKKKLLLENGIIEIDTESGIFRFVSDSSKFGLDKNTESLLSKLGGIQEVFGFAVGFGAEVYENYKDTLDVINGVKGCIDSYSDWMKLQKGPSAKLGLDIDPIADLELQKEKVKVAGEFIEKANDQLGVINQIQIEKLQDPSLEPVFLDNQFTSGTGLLTVSAVEKIEEEDDESPVFRLVFGPPKSKSGQFLLSVDGLYYDSQSGGLPEVSGFIPPQSQKWKLDFAPNLGGKGEAISLKEFDKYVDTLFDPELIDDSPSMQTHYKEDHFLQVLRGQKHKHIYDLSGYIVDLEASGTFAADSAVMTNFRQSLYSNIAIHNSKIRRRKKQIEVAIKSPQLFGKDTAFAPGEVPINDFSYLEGVNFAVAVEKQKQLIFRTGEVSGVVLPLKPKFVTAQEAEGPTQIDHLVVPDVGTGGIIFGPPHVSSTVQTVLSLNDHITTNGLFAIYNILKSDVEPPGSCKFNLLNCMDPLGAGDALLIGQNTSSVFFSGLAIPYLNGIAEVANPGATPSNVASFIQLPNHQKFQDMLYTAKGMTFECWMHVPDIGTSSILADPTFGWGTSALHKVILGNENIGGTASADNINKITFGDDSDNVRGLTMGFTRDVQITSSLSPNTPNEQQFVSGMAFYIAPTQSVNETDIAYVNRDDCTDFSVHKCMFNAYDLVSGVRFTDVSSNFMHLAVVVDPPNNAVTLYLDSVEMATSTIPDTFGSKQYAPPGIPTFKKNNSFEYSSSSTGLEVFKNGPTLASYFTPWIVGGGFTDGMVRNGQFMGSKHGSNSGLGGFLGSIKFYDRALNINEVTKNFKAQKPFFKNIDTYGN